MKKTTTISVSILILFIFSFACNQGGEKKSATPENSIAEQPAIPITGDVADVLLPEGMAGVRIRGQVPKDISKKNARKNSLYGSYNPEITRIIIYVYEPGIECYIGSYYIYVNGNGQYDGVIPIPGDDSFIQAAAQNDFDDILFESEKIFMENAVPGKIVKVNLFMGRNNPPAYNGALKVTLTKSVDADAITNGSMTIYDNNGDYIGWLWFYFEKGSSTSYSQEINVPAGTLNIALRSYTESGWELQSEQTGTVDITAGEVNEYKFTLDPNQAGLNINFIWDTTSPEKILKK